MCLADSLWGAVKGVRVLGRPFWGRYAHGIIDWLTINVVLYLAFTAQVRFVHGQQVCGTRNCRLFRLSR